MIYRLWPALTVIALLSLSTPGYAGSSTSKQHAENFEAHTLEGKLVQFADLKGKVTIVAFWASWCFPCHVELPLLQKLYDRLHDQGLQVIAVAVDDKLDAVKAYQGKKSFRFPVLFDDTGNAQRALGATSVPETFIVDRDNRLAGLQDPATKTIRISINDPLVWRRKETETFLRDLLNSE